MEKYEAIPLKVVWTIPPSLEVLHKGLPKGRCFLLDTVNYVQRWREPQSASSEF